MQRILLVTAIIFVSLITTACVNRFAVQELNNNAKILLSKGDIQGAISRLESSIDIDENLYETHYNLAVAYVQAQEYDKALKQLEKTIELKPDFADSFHTMGVIYEEKAMDIITGEENKDKQFAENNSLPALPEQNTPKQLSNEEKEQVIDYYEKAIDAYNKYLMKNLKAEDKDALNEKINKINEKLKKYNTEFIENQDNQNG